MEGVETQHSFTIFKPSRIQVPGMTRPQTLQGT
jgi:hypothetical protein